MYILCFICPHVAEDWRCPHRLPQMVAGGCFESESPMLINDSRKSADYVRRLQTIQL